ncbi:hypothetical protein IFM89_001791 [Coptis chinensis]|uniref:Hpc2-related domain-containing protein n=1 Tax=Coptis chinensis TaxID=261450 RepID=A0A835LLY9_9MAGN|nr:hypothetical protein IFM89_001791 [Coptis chinensis]
MAEEKVEGVSGGGESGVSRVTTAFPSGGVVIGGSSSSSKPRQRFSIELKTDETTIVSWKKLVKESINNNNNNNPSVSSSAAAAAEPPPSGAHPALQSRIAPQGQPAECDAPPTDRFSAVIEKIERLYVGNESSDEDELAEVPDDDQYDTEDSFIDDADLDEYFQVDKSTTKHKGFFVNRGKLERTNEHSSSPKHQPKKRRRKDLTTHSEKEDDHLPNKQAKVGNVKMKNAAKTAPLVDSKSSSPSHSLSGKSEHCQDEKSFDKSNAPLGPSKKKPSDLNIKLEQFTSSDVHKDRLETKDGEKHKSGVNQSRDLGSKMKAASESSDAMHHIYQDKNYFLQMDSQPRRLTNETKELEPSHQNSARERSIAFLIA